MEELYRGMIPEAVVNEVHRPHHVGRVGDEQPLFGTGRQAPAAPAADAQPHRHVDAVRALVVDRVTGVPQPPERLPESDAGVLGDQAVELVDPRAVATFPGHVGDRRSGNTGRLTGLQHAQPVPVHELEGKFPSR